MPRIWNDYIPILNEYQATRDTNFRGFRLGTDRSYNYSHEKESFLVIADAFSEMAVSFKAFIKDFSISFKFDTKDLEPIGGTNEVVQSIGIRYNIGLDIPAISADDAMVNSARLDAIMIMMDKNDPSFLGPTLEGLPRPGNQTDQQKLVLLSNLIHNGKYTNKKAVRNFEELNKYALRCYLNKFSFKPNIDMGFFEISDSGSQKLYAKVYEVNFDILAKPLFTINEKPTKRIMSGFNDDGTIDAKEFTASGSWPFGVNTK